MRTDEPEFARARWLAALGRLDEARAALAAVLRASPDHLGALLLRATLLQEERQDEPALEVCRRAVEAWPRSAEALNGLARCLHALGRHAEALECARRAQALLAEGDNALQAAPVYLTLVWCLRELRRYREALAAAEEGLERVADGVLAHWASVVEEDLARAERQRC
jgi:tetratricopeptide (TPR) repeat protein